MADLFIAAQYLAGAHERNNFKLKVESDFV